MIFVRIGWDGKSSTVDGDLSIQTVGYKDKGWFIAESFGFGVEREMKESGEKGGTEDINIGVGELQECTITKSMDLASPALCQLAINGNSPGAAEIHFVEVAGAGATGRPTCYLAYKLDRCFVKSWSTSGDSDSRPTEDVAFYYNRIAFRYAATADGKIWVPSTTMKWDNTTQAEWDHNSKSSEPKIDFDAESGGFKITPEK